MLIGRRGHEVGHKQRRSSWNEAIFLEPWLNAMLILLAAVCMANSEGYVRVPMGRDARHGGAGRRMELRLPGNQKHRASG